eukprot:Phypoly_transcript_16822.p1 GENE.Phypoly_transcript_16822~~Phypoly_transcript_16822.p1  ORF type:complete len:219 (+),score=25.91 Phypoly_transcript_16822:45-701(+)
MATTKEEPPRDVKLAVLGINGVGKSSLVIQFVHGHFILEYDPTIEDSYRKIVKLPDFMNQVSDKSPQILIDLLDTAAEEVGMRDRYVRTAQGFAMVYSVTNNKSFEALEPFVQKTYKEKDMLDDWISRYTTFGSKSLFSVKSRLRLLSHSCKIRTRRKDMLDGTVYNTVNKKHIAFSAKYVQRDNSLFLVKSRSRLLSHSCKIRTKRKICLMGRFPLC